MPCRKQKTGPPPENRCRITIALPATASTKATAFCEVELPASAPTFLFFFGLIYEDDDGEIEAEVQVAIQEGKHISARMVADWLAFAAIY